MKKTLWLNIFKTIQSSYGRFLSMSALLFLGAFALVGLSVTGPNIEKTLQSVIHHEQMADLFVMNTMGLTQEDKATLEAFQKKHHAKLEMSYFQDVMLFEKKTTLRLFSLTQQISKPSLLSGSYPTTPTEIALSHHLQEQYNIGDTISLVISDNESNVKSLTVTGFVSSIEYISNQALGQTSVGNGTLNGLAYTTEDFFNLPVWTIARLQFQKTDSPFSDTYQSYVGQLKEDLLPLLDQQNKTRFNTLKNTLQTEIDRAATQVLTLSQQRDNLKAIPQAKQQYDTLQQTITDIQQKIDTAKKQYDTLEEPKHMIYTRATMLGSSGYDTLSATAKGIMSVSYVFPIVLYGVAILVAVTTMTRLVNEERLNAGILKALGYSNHDVMTKFIVYGALAGILGTMTGAISGLYGLPTIIGKTLLADTVLPEMQLSFDWPLLLMTLVITLSCSIVPALFVVSKELKTHASELLIAKLPTIKTRKILLERIPFIWEKLSFTQKVTARNMFRYKQRFIMTIFGVAGSVALLFSGLGILSSLNGIISRQYNTLLQYDVVLLKESHISDEQSKALSNALADSHIDRSLPIQMQSFDYTTGKKETLQLLVMATENDFHPLINMKMPGTQTSIPVTNEGAVINEKLANLLQLKIGDTLTLTYENTHINIPISNIMEMYAGHYVLLKKASYESIFKKAYVPNAYLIDYTKDTDNSEMSKQLLQMAGVKSVMQNQTTIDRIQQLVHSLTVVMGILVLVSVILSMVILYNLTTINVIERLRELSTIKVLGFYPYEVTLYIYRETTVLSLIGMVIGIGLGIPLHQLLINVTATNMMMFHPTVELWVYITPIILVSNIIAILGIHVHRYLKSVNMLDALKSVE